MESQYLNDPIKIYSTQKKDMKLFKGISVWYIGVGGAQFPIFMLLYAQKIHLIFIIPIVLISLFLGFNGVRWSNKYKGRRNFRNIIRTITQRKQKFETYNVEAIRWAEIELAENLYFDETVDDMEDLLLTRLANLGHVDSEELVKLNNEHR